MSEEIPKKLDNLDRAILRALQEDSSVSQRELASKVFLSQNACWRRYKRLREEGYIKAQTVKLDAKSVGLGQTIFMFIRTRSHSTEWLDEFRTLILSIENVVDFYRVAGDYDYMLKVVVKDMEGFDSVYRQIIGAAGLDAVTSYVAMEAIADGRNLPV